MFLIFFTLFHHLINIKVSVNFCSTPDKQQSKQKEKWDVLHANKLDEQPTTILLQDRAHSPPTVFRALMTALALWIRCDSSSSDSWRPWPHCWTSWPVICFHKFLFLLWFFRRWRSIYIGQCCCRQRGPSGFIKTIKNFSIQFSSGSRWEQQPSLNRGARWCRHLDTDKHVVVVVVFFTNLCCCV